MHDIVKNLKARRLVREAQVCQGAVLPALRSVGWDDSNPTEVHPEFPVKSRKVDYALCANGSPKVFIEVKALGKLSVQAEKQVFAYAANNGIPLLLLTDGNRWEFFLSMAAGQPRERLFASHTLDNPDQQAALSESLEQFLHKDRVVSQRARRSAEEALEAKISRQRAEQQIGAAWKQLIADDELLRELVSDKVRDLCGDKPHTEDVNEFLASLAVTADDDSLIHRRPASKRSESRAASAAPAKRKRNPRIRACLIQGVEVSGSSGKAVLVKTLQHLASADPGFLQRMADDPRNSTDTWRFLSKDRNSLYRSPRRNSSYSEIADGWWAATNLTGKGIENLLRKACQVAGMSWDDDFRVVWESLSPS